MGKTVFFINDLNMEKIKEKVDEIKDDFDKNLLQKVTVRKVLKDDLQLYLDLCLKEEWNKGLDQFEMMLETCPDGFWCAEIEGEKTVSFCGAYDIGNRQAIVANFITKKGYRKKGIGSIVLNKVIAHYKDYMIFINSIEGKEKYYGKFGFTTDIYSTNHVIAKPKPILNELASGNLFRKCLQSEEISIEEFSDFTDEINKFDLEISPFLRNIKWFVKTSEFCLLARCLESRSILGFLCVRKVNEGLSYQPFYANNSKVAERLLIKARSKNWRDEQVQFFVPEENENGLELIEKYYSIKSKSGNTWLSLGKKFEVQSKKIVSI